MKSAGVLPYRRDGHLEVLVAHPGGPFWARKDEGAWSVIKGLVEEGEDPLDTARREFTEETGWQPPSAPWVDLGEVRLRSGKLVAAWAAHADYDPSTLQPGEFTTTLRGRQVSFPEIDRVAWYDPATARRKLNPVYGEFLDRLEAHLDE
ncbi:MAG: NUDIX domain-containing protein [Acidimicrobiia bacterium]